MSQQIFWKELDFAVEEQLDTALQQVPNTHAIIKN